MSFEWKVEEHALIKEKPAKRTYKSYNTAWSREFACERKVSREDKIAFVDSFCDGKLSYILELAEKYAHDKDDLPHDKYGDVKTVSFKAWAKKNDPKKVIDTEYRYGVVWLKVAFKFNAAEHTNKAFERNIKTLFAKGAYDTYADPVDEAFHETLWLCHGIEQIHFRMNDEYSILEDKIMKRLQNGNFYQFGLPLIFGSDGLWLSENGTFDKCRRLTVAEMWELLNKNEEVERFVSSLAETVNITF